MCEDVHVCLWHSALRNREDEVMVSVVSRRACDPELATNKEIATECCENQRCGQMCLV